MIKFELGVCGYPGEFTKNGYPQATMFAALNEIVTENEGKIIKYDQVQTS